MVLQLMICLHLTNLLFLCNITSKHHKRYKQSKHLECAFSSNQWKMSSSPKISLDRCIMFSSSSVIEVNALENAIP